MRYIEENLFKTESLLKNGGPVYMFSNENVAGYLRQIPNINGARVLSVAAAGEHAFTAYELGATHVDTFDANIFQRAVQDLKLIMIKNLAYDDFQRFCFAPNASIQQEILSPIADKLPTHVNDFLKLSYSSTEFVRLWHPSEYVYDAGRYEKLRHVLPNEINFTHIDLENLAEKFSPQNRKYDVILLSNIIDYLPRDVVYDKCLMPIADNLLATGGVIVYMYKWMVRNLDWYGAYPINGIIPPHADMKNYEFNAVSFRNNLNRFDDAVFMMRKARTL